MGKERIEKIFKTGKPVLSLYLTAGYPEKDAMPKIAKSLQEYGVDFIEVGMPYSDPLADGETIQKSSHTALKNGMNLKTYFEQVKSISKQTNLPQIFMGYFNQILQYGPKAFLEACVEAGIDGLIIPDLSPEIYETQYKDLFESYNLAFIFLVTPTTSEARIKKIDELSSGFVYVVSTSATTGNEKGFGDEEIAYFKRIKKLLRKNPGVLGFGINTHQKYIIANKYLDGAIIGSAFIKKIGDRNKYLSQAKKFVKEIKAL